MGLYVVFANICGKCCGKQRPRALKTCTYLFHLQWDVLNHPVTSMIQIEDPLHPLDPEMAPFIRVHVQGPAKRASWNQKAATTGSARCLRASKSRGAISTKAYLHVVGRGDDRVH